MLLDKGWKLRLTKPDGSVTETGASVPGCVTTDLIKSGVIDYDIFWRDNADRAQWVEDCGAEYICEFVSEDDSPAEIIFHGLDTYATAYLNGAEICSADDMFIKYRSDVSRVLKKGTNVLKIRFESPVKKVSGRPEREAAFTFERLYTRRIQCTYGWDWVNRFVTMGIWKPVELRRIKADRMPPGNEGIYISTLGINRYSAQIFVRLDFESFSGDEYAEITVSDPEGNPVTVRKRRIMSGFVEEYLDIPSPRLWWPNGYGAQPLYTLAVIFGGERKVQKFGIRTVSILEFADAPGSDGRLLSDRLKSFPHLKEWDRNETTSCFTLLVNGVKIFCQGGCWVPCEPFPSSESDEKIRSVVGLARLGNVNMIRVWGGGIFEHESFYDACDENGILVTQDFLMACGNYPEEDDGFIEHLKNETEEGARLLRNHPCLVWWTGDNENAVRGSENDVYYTGKRAALDGIAPVLKALDPCRRFLPSSPYGGVPFASATAGTTHNTNFIANGYFRWAQAGDFSGYREFFERFLCRFCAEQPSLGMPFVSSLRNFMSEEDIFGDDSRISEYHTKNNPGIEGRTIYGYIELLAKGIFGEFKSGEDRIKKMQLLQCEWVRLSLELFRRNRWYSSGVVYWMLNDCWPAAGGWSLIDYYGRPKPAFYAFKRCAKPVVASVVIKKDDTAQIFISVNGTHSEFRGTGRVYIYDIVSGQETALSEFSFRADAADGSLTVSDGGQTACFDLGGGAFRAASVNAALTDKRTVLICDVSSDICCDRAFSLSPETTWGDMDWPGEDVTVSETGDSFIVSARSTVPAVLIDSASVTDDNCFFIKKGETKIIKKLS